MHDDDKMSPAKNVYLRELMEHRAIAQQYIVQTKRTVGEYRSRYNDTDGQARETHQKMQLALESYYRDLKPYGQNMTDLWDETIIQYDNGQELSLATFERELERCGEKVVQTQQQRNNRLPELVEVVEWEFIPVYIAEAIHDQMNHGLRRLGVIPEPPERDIGDPDGVAL